MDDRNLFDETAISLEARLDADIQQNGKAAPIEADGAIGTTMFDLPGSEDNTITVLLPKDAAQSAPSQALVRVQCGDSTLLARVTLRAVDALGLVAGKPVWAQVKSVALAN